MLPSNLHLKQALARLRKSSFAKNVLVVMTGTALAQVIGFALSPLISRLFSPSDFGIFGSFNSVSTIIAAAATLEYTQAIMLPKETEDAINLFVVSCLCTAAVALLCFLLCLLAPSFVHGLMRTSGVWALALLVLATVVSGLNVSCQAWCVRVKAFKDTSASQVVRSLSGNGTQVGLGYLKGGAPSLIVASVLADMLASLNLARVTLPHVLALRRSIRWEQMRRLMKDYKDFPLYAATQNIVNVLSLGLPVLLLTRFYGIAVAGAYAFGVRILQVPMGFVLTALKQVLLQKACETHNNGDSLLPLYVKFTGGLFALAFLPALVLFIWAPQIFVLVFGHQWHLAGVFAKSLVVWLTLLFCNVPSVIFARIIRMQRSMFLLDLALLAARVLVLVAGGIYLSASSTIVAFSAVGAVLNIIFIVMVGRALMRESGDVAWSRIPNCLAEG